MGKKKVTFILLYTCCETDVQFGCKIAIFKLLMYRITHLASENTLKGFFVIGYNDGSVSCLTRQLVGLFSAYMLSCNHRFLLIVTI